GQPLWKADTFVTRSWNYSITGAPHVAGSRILIGNAGADMGARGYVSAYDARTGRLAWRFWAVPGDPAAGPDESPEVTLARKTWPQDSRWDLGLGGNAWDELAYERATNTAYLGLGNGGPHPAWLRSRSGARMDNLFLTCVVAVDAASGHMKWYYQTTPQDSWDFAATSPMIFAELKIDGRLHHVLMQAPKNGFFYVLDRRTGQLLRANAYTSVNWAHGVNLETGRPEFAAEGDYSRSSRIIWPSAAGGHSWAPMAFSPRTGLVYLPVFDGVMRYTSEPLARFVPGAINQAARGQFPPFDSPEDRAELAGQPPVRFEGRLKAWDPIAGKARWQSEPLPFVSGGTLVAGDLVFQGSTDGYLYAYQAETGELRARLFTGSAIMAAPIAYRLDGVEYLALTAGAGGPQGAAFAPNVVASQRENFERLLVLRLQGSPVPLPAPRSETPPPPPPQPIDAGPEALAHGQALFRQMCQRCHPVGGALGIYPNLWHMSQSTADLFEAIVGQGALREAGMGNFSDSVSASDIAAIKAFIIDDINLKRSEGAKSGASSRDAYH
ncbi:MAG TPA: PQQ-binding-like beta-propeller repeat protein, partial [Steroidobacteraceae bacterium]|nr:PQQ-binding-like beta-propeller repeat protein [Steroidobacteraceae bacterium]